MDQQVIHSKPATQSTFGTRLRKLLFRKIWLPGSAYASLPGLYIFLGIYAIAAALYLQHWSWIVPYLLLLGIGCVHAGIVVLSMRFGRRHGHDRSENLPE